jgi:hypothetical protein
MASCYTCGTSFESASFMVSLREGHLIRFLVSECSISWTEMRDDRELMKLEGAEAIRQLQDLAEPANSSPGLERSCGIVPPTVRTSHSSHSELAHRGAF